MKITRITCKGTMKATLFCIGGMLLANSVSAQTQKTEPQKKIDSVRAVQVEEQREGTISTPVVTGSPTETQTGAQSQSNAVETRNTGTTIVVNPATKDNNLPLQQSTAPRKRAENTTPNSGINTPRSTNSRTNDTIGRSKAATTVRASTNNNTGSKTTGRKAGTNKRKETVKKTN